LRSINYAIRVEIGRNLADVNIPLLAGPFGRLVVDIQTSFVTGREFDTHLPRKDISPKTAEFVVAAMKYSRYEPQTMPDAEDDFMQTEIELLPLALTQDDVDDFIQSRSDQQLVNIILTRILPRLDSRRRDIFVSRIYAAPDEEQILQQLADKYGVTKQRISQLQIRALEIVKKALNGISR
jgi:hypothetical protein